MTRSRRRRSVRVRACAKVNLTLRVLGLRADGYHDLRTTFQALALHDTLTFTETAGPFRLTCDDPRCPPDETNLVWRAARRLWRERRRRGDPAGIAAHIAKRIPVEGGLGGGSSDAAATLHALATIWGMELDPVALHDIARELGADVPFFLQGGTALGVDRGDTLFQLADLPAHFVVLVVPSFGISTRDAYAWWDAGPASVGAARAVRAPFPLGVAERGNDLEAAVAGRHPEIPRIARGLRRGGALDAGMSGSGSAVFGLFKRRADAERAARAWAAPAQRTLVTRTLDRAAYARLTRPTLSTLSPLSPVKR
jgi:4-diphosphocytidyl-2-C-methyl-D-erythritol kinase